MPVFSKHNYLLILSLVLCSLGWMVNYFSKVPYDKNEFTSTLKSKIQLELNKTNPFFVPESFQDILDNKSITKEKITFLIFNKNDSLLYWNNNLIFPYQSELGFNHENQTKQYEIAGSIYLLKKAPFQPKQFSVDLDSSYAIALIPIYQYYPIQNSYLKNQFTLLNSSLNSHFVLDRNNEGFLVEISTWGISFQVKQMNQSNNTILDTITYVIFLISALIFILFLCFLFKSYVAIKSPIVESIFLIVGSVLISLFFCEWILPCWYVDIDYLKYKIIFGKDLSIDLGKLIFIILVVSVSSVYVFIPGKKVKSNDLGWGWSYDLWFNSLIGFTYFIFLYLIFTVSSNGSVYIGIEDPSSFQFNSLLIIVSLIAYIFFTFLAIDYRLRESKSKNIGMVFFGALVTSIVYFSLLKDWSLYLILIFFYFSFLFLYRYFKRFVKFTLNWLIIWLIFYSFFSALIIERCNQIIKTSTSAECINEILEERDRDIEEFLQEKINQISSDPLFKNYLNSPYIPLSQIQERLNYLYLDPLLFGNYQYKVQFFNALGKSRNGENDLPTTWVNAQKQHKSISKNILLIDNPNESAYYLIRCDVKNKDILIGSILIEVIPKNNNEESNIYIEILKQSKKTKTIDLHSYCFALIKSEKIVRNKNFDIKNLAQINKHPYSKHNIHPLQIDDKYYILKKDSSNKIAVVQTEKENFFKPVSIFSFIFICGTFWMILVLILVQSFDFLWKTSYTTLIFNMTLSENIQRGLLISSIFSFIAIAFVTSYFFREEFQRYQKQRLEKRMENTVRAAQWQIKQREDSSLFIPEAKEISSIYKMDVNVYSSTGQLISSSQESVFDRKLVSKFMNRIAFDSIQNSSAEKISLGENISDFKFISGYAGLKDKNEQIIAYLHIPYDLQKNKYFSYYESSNFLGTLLNLYTLLLLLASLYSFFLSRSVTRPLNFIGDQLKEITIFKSNEKIQLQSKLIDVKALVEKFNQMIDQLEENARQLSRNQRELVWREVARQVAHEINNPITPMKLQIQLLDRIAKEDPNKAMEMLPKVTNSILLSIETLSKISEDFSSYAKMPPPVNEIINLSLIIDPVVSLFNGDTDILVEWESDSEPMVEVDKTHLHRALVNLIKNGIQAIPSNKKGQIRIKIEKKKANLIQISIQDNGIGIPEEEYDKVFLPNFTTKNYGNGIGLPMTKSIVESAGGQIYFKSTLGLGTCFYIQLPLLTKD